MGTIEIISNAACRLLGATAKQIKDLDDALSFLVPGHEFAPSFRQHVWDGKRHLYSRYSGQFPTGVLHRATATLPGAKIVDRRIKRSAAPNPEKLLGAHVQGEEERDYQIDAIFAFLERGRGVLKLATGAGKQRCAAAVMRCFPTSTILYVVHTKALLRQSRTEICRFLGLIEEHVGVIGDGRFDATKRITVATTQSIASWSRKSLAFRRWLASMVDVLVWDECQHVKAVQTFKVAQSIGAEYRLGLSATPWDNARDQLVVEGALGPILSEVSSATLIGRGLLADPEVSIVTYESPELSSEWDWHRIYRAGIVENAERNSKLVDEVEKLVAAGKKTLIMVSHVWHGEILSTILRASGVRHEFVHAKVHGDAIEEAKERFRAGSFPVLMASPIFGEGIDIPEVDALVVADGKQGLKNLLQKVGRALRRKSGANTASIVDFADMHHPMLARHSARRIAIYEKEKFRVVTS